ncbi:MAG: NADP-dependent malic enzyme [Burkholderiales bacterium]|nr:NADP-dependent malic enzyme [Burkholderiales bacterium]
MSNKFNLDSQLTKDALEYHRSPKPGKTQVVSTKPVASQRDLSLAYSPGVAAPCLEIENDPNTAYEYTNKGNLVGVISNGTAVLGLGNIGALAGKPVMEGKGILFKKFAGIDVFDIEVNETDIDKFVEVVAALEPTFGGINLEDIKAPECFEIERKLKERLDIPVFHDDQHGTAIVVASGVKNGLEVVGKKLPEVKIVVSGAGAAAIACLNLLVSMGANKKNIYVCDSKGVVHTGRDNLDISKKQYVQETNYRTLEDAMEKADIFLGLSGPGTATEEMIIKMARDPLVFALANPTPEIMPEIVHRVRPDAIMATGRSDYPNQVNNALCFPYIFRGALDVGATTINEEMKIATVNAIAELAKEEPHEMVTNAYLGQELRFGREYLIPKPLDPRLIRSIAPAVAKAAIATGVAKRPISDFGAYFQELSQYMYRTSMLMRPITSAAHQKPIRIVICEGEEERALLAASEAIQLKIARPILIGRPFVIEKRIEKLGLTIKPNIDFDLINIDNDSRYKATWQEYYQIMKRKGITEHTARDHVLSRHSLIGSMLLKNGEADGMICGLAGNFTEHYNTITNLIGFNNDKKIAAAVNALILQNGNLFITDTHVNHNPTAEELAEITKMSVDVIQKFGIEPRVALVSHSNFGSHMNSPTSIKMRSALNIIQKQQPDLIIDGEMHADAALRPEILERAMKDSPLGGNPANLLVMPNVDSASIAYNLLRVSSSDGVTVGPILMGMNKPAHILSNLSTVRRIVNMIAYACVEAQHQQHK